MASTSDTGWLHLLKGGDHAAAQILWERYFRLLVSCARRRLGDSPRRAADEEDVALSAFNSFCRGVEADRFPRLQDRDDLRCVLLMLVARKAAHQVRAANAQKKGSSKVGVLGELPEEHLAQLIDSTPTPQTAAQAAEECCRLLAKLRDDDLRTIALWQVEGFTIEEIAAKMGRAPATATIYRKLAEIRDLWRDEGAP